MKNKTVKINLLQCSVLCVSLLLAGCAPSMMEGGAVKDGAKGGTPSRLDVAQPAPDVAANGLVLTSPEIADGSTIPVEQTCTGDAVSPALAWSGAPTGTVAYALTAFDPDAPTGSGFWHWVNYNIPVSATGFDKGAGSKGGTLPEGTATANNSGGSAGYAGPCPPIGAAAHRYQFTLYALSKTLDIPAGASPEFIGFNLNGATLAKTSFTGTYGRDK